MSRCSRCGVDDGEGHTPDCPKLARPAPAPHVAEVVTLYDSNMRDPVATLRKIADQIERKEYGEVGCLAVVLLGDTMEVFGAGSDSEGPSVAVLLHAGFSRISNAIETHGRKP